MKVKNNDRKRKNRKSPMLLKKKKNPYNPELAQTKLFNLGINISNIINPNHRSLRSHYNKELHYMKNLNNIEGEGYIEKNKIRIINGAPRKDIENCIFFEHNIVIHCINHNELLYKIVNSSFPVLKCEIHNSNDIIFKFIHYFPNLVTFKLLPINVAANTETLRHYLAFKECIPGIVKSCLNDQARNPNLVHQMIFTKNYSTIYENNLQYEKQKRVNNFVNDSNDFLFNKSVMVETNQISTSANVPKDTISPCEMLNKSYNNNSLAENNKRSNRLEILEKHYNTADLKIKQDGKPSSKLPSYGKDDEICEKKYVDPFLNLNNSSEYKNNTIDFVNQVFRNKIPVRTSLMNEVGTVPSNRKKMNLIGKSFKTTQHTKINPKCLNNNGKSVLITKTVENIAENEISKSNVIDDSELSRNSSVESISSEEIDVVTIDPSPRVITSARTGIPYFNTMYNNCNYGETNIFAKLRHTDPYLNEFIMKKKKKENLTQTHMPLRAFDKKRSYLSAITNTKNNKVVNHAKEQWQSQLNCVNFHNTERNEEYIKNKFTNLKCIETDLNSSMPFANDISHDYNPPKQSNIDIIEKIEKIEMSLIIDLCYENIDLNALEQIPINELYNSESIDICDYVI